MLQFNKEYQFMELMDGDRFYFANDTKKVKTVYQIRWDLSEYNGRSIKKDTDLHFTRATTSVKATKVIFLRHTGTQK